MTRYSVQLRDWIFLKAYGFLSFARNVGKHIGKNISKNLSSKYSCKLLDHAKQPATDTLKTASKKQFKKQQKQLVIWLGIKLLIELQMSKKLHHRIIPKQLQMKKIGIYLQKKDSKLLII